MGRKKDTLQQRSAKMTDRRRYHYNDETPFIELFKRKRQYFLIAGKIAWELKALLRNGDKVNIKKLTFLEFRLEEDEEDEKTPCSCTQVYQWLAKLLLAVGDEGTKYGKTMIFRYLTDGHSNLFEKESSLKTSVNRELRKIRLTHFKERVTC